MNPSEHIRNLSRAILSITRRIFLTDRMWGVTIAFVLGALIGLGAYTFIYARGFSYLSADPQACVNCHAMNQVFEGWMKGDHRHVAGCNDCHLPHGFFGKWFVKSENGFYHSLVFTFMSVPVNIEARARSRDVVEANCRRCHEWMAYYAIGGVNGRQDSLSCLGCHRSTGHAHHR